ncbi:hypothetical protein THASP1DRAFT_33096 [Thamnocephalis sphaerospora]|uniref:Uncharacterized protein n=1 Tax=Thamnocephalis sphaerospora TaxID=78915 RepID=A0A4P9XHC5_9FUNG|nr:hypothetical protein THASP1DRAFT_33096 [Thamnocephalis sphaerospora]|eukprot:RKP05075.1 hypothetical protein THASP1DRAFT_33096 [Thamnocephalis sphaerospora]
MPSVSVVGVVNTAAPVVRMAPLTPPGFSGAIAATVAVDNPNWVDWTFESITADLLDADSGKKVGEGLLENQPLSARTVQNITIPFKLDYVGESDKDPVTLRYVGICRPAPGKPTMYKVRATMAVKGLSGVYKPTIEKDVLMTCPPTPAAAPSASAPAAGSTPAADGAAAQPPAAQQ